MCLNYVVACDESALEKTATGPFRSRGGCRRLLRGRCGRWGWFWSRGGVCGQVLLLGRVLRSAPGARRTARGGKRQWKLGWRDEARGGPTGAPVPSTYVGRRRCNNATRGALLLGRSASAGLPRDCTGLICPST